MLFRTQVRIPKPHRLITPHDRILFAGSCFADNIGRRFVDEGFTAKVNPYGVMYNPASVMHTAKRVSGEFSADVAVFTLGTNHVYILNSTGEIVDNCMKRPQSMFTERELSVDECTGFLHEAASAVRVNNPDAHVIVTVSPIRYAKYGFHGSQLSKAVLLLAAERFVKEDSMADYFPAYEIVNDELRDYRFYKSDMLHPSEQTVDYIWECLLDCFLSDEARNFVREWQPIKAALNHKPFNPESEEYKAFVETTEDKLRMFRKKWGKEASPQPQIEGSPSPTLPWGREHQAHRKS
ncbi:MAG: GSCFA domain-containing protein [Prevotella sp.]|nr:GSCFA domain-containing protein [Prevotella sp.]